MNKEYKIVKFTKEHLEDAGIITLNFFGEVEKDVPVEMRKDLFQFLAHYYFDYNSEFNFAITDGEKLCGFLLASKDKHYQNDAEKIMRSLTDDAHMPLFEIYNNYLNGNRDKEHDFILNDEVMLLLYMSAEKGCGKLLFNHFKEECLKHNIHSTILWTDETCNLDYYYKNSFTEVAKMKTTPKYFDHDLNTYIFRKEFR